MDPFLGQKLIQTCHWWCWLQCVPSECWKEAVRKSPTTVERTNEWRPSRTNIQSPHRSISSLWEFPARKKFGIWGWSWEFCLKCMKILEYNFRKIVLREDLMLRRKQTNKLTSQHVYKHESQSFIRIANSTRRWWRPGWKVERSTSYHGKEICVSEKELKSAGWQLCWLKEDSKS